MDREENSVKEKTTNTLTHAIGLLLSIIATIVLIKSMVNYENSWRLTSVAIYSTTLITLYTASTLRHAFPLSKKTQLHHVIDHSAIYLFIAGSYTPFLLVAMRGLVGWILFVIIWAAALTGTISGILSIKIPRLSFKINYIIASYLVMGWFSLIGIPFLIKVFPLEGIIWLAGGGVFYTIGVLFLFADKIPFNHSIWHVLVVAGSACHYFAILFYIMN